MNGEKLVMAASADRLDSVITPPLVVGVAVVDAGGDSPAAAAESESSLLVC